MESTETGERSRHKPVHSTAGARSVPKFHAILRWRNLLAMVLLLLLTLWTVGVVSGTVASAKRAHDDLTSPTARNTDDDILHAGDFPMFYIGTQTIVSENREHTYEKQAIFASAAKLWDLDIGSLPQTVRVWYRYYNPPFYLLALSPLTLLHLDQAYLVMVAINVIALALLIAVVGTILKWRQPTAMITLVMVPGLIGVPASIYHTQPTILIALLISLAFLAQRSGRSRVAATMAVVAGIKPQWAVAAAVALVRERFKTLEPLILIGIVVILVPFLFLGVGALEDYIKLVLGRGGNDLSDANYAAHVLSWPGFMVALTGSTEPLAALILSLLSLAIFCVVLKGGDEHLTWAASILLMLVVLPHSHPQDWMLVAPAAAFILARPTKPSLRPATNFLLVLGYIALNSWAFTSGTVEHGGRSIYFATPAALMLLAWCAALPLLENVRSKNVAPEIYPACDAQPV